MTRLLFISAALIGSAAIAWMGLGFLSAHPLALAITALIALGFGIGFAELIYFRRDTTALRQALGNAPAADNASRDALDKWLGDLPTSLASSVRLRIAGEQAPLPAPAAPSQAVDAAPPPPPEPEIPPEELERNKKITAEQRKANRLIVAGAVSAGVIGPVLLVSPLAFLVANRYEDQGDDPTRPRNVGIATGVIGGIGVTAGLTAGMAMAAPSGK